MIEWYVSNYVFVSGILFFFGAFWHLVLNLFSFENSWDLGAFVTKALTSGSAAIIPPFIFSFWQKDILQRIEGVEFYLAISALVLFYFFIQSLVPKGFNLSTFSPPKSANNPVATSKREP